MNDNILQKALTPQEVADMLQISKNTVYELIKRGELNGYRVGNKVRVDLEDIKAYKGETKSAGFEPVSEAPKKNPLFNEYVPVENGFVICGQDIMLDNLSLRLEQMTRPTQRVLRSYISSYNGIFALYNDEVQVAAAHLWDGNTGEYNVSYIRSMLPGTPAVIINLAYRMQGFYVPFGNPKGIHTWEDLRRPDITISNREKGSGTRVLLDEHLRLLGIDGNHIQGYQRECPTHLACAGVVARGGADVALGSEKTAMQVSKLEFVPLQKERYDIVFKKANINKPLYQAVVRLLQSPDFVAEMTAIGGYDTTETGKIIAET
jgi:DNA binding domain, excisionase family